jgi:hypothetical protein
MDLSVSYEWNCNNVLYFLLKHFISFFFRCFGVRMTEKQCNKPRCMQTRRQDVHPLFEETMTTIL